MFVVNSAVITYNAALNRPAYQSSVYDGEAVGPFQADYANDGSRHIFYNNGTKCAVTIASDTNPWWAVDLGHPTAIYRVDLTSSFYARKSL